MEPEVHKCGVCGAEFPTEQAYLEHECSTGFKPTDVAHQDALTGGAFSQQAERALERGEARKDEEVHPAETAEVEAPVEEPK